MHKFSWIKSLLSSIFAVLMVSVSTSATAMPVEFIIQEKQYAFSDCYEIESGGFYQGSLIKSKVALRNTYEFHDQSGVMVSSAYLRILSLGSLYTWAGVLDIYDFEGNTIGCIQGTMLTTLPAKFSFYNENNELVATAYMDRASLGFNIVDPKNERVSLARMHRIFIKDFVDPWVITMNDGDALDLRLLCSFAAFILDNQSKFRFDN